jgi:NACHT domain
MLLGGSASSTVRVGQTSLNDPQRSRGFSRSEPMTPSTRTEAGILVLLDMVEYTPQVKALGDEKAAQLGRYFKDEVVRRASPRGFEHFKALGDAALLFGKGDDAPCGLIELMLDLFTREPIQPHLGFKIRLRMIAHSGYFVLEFNAEGRRIDVHGCEAIKEFRIEKLAATGQLLVTDPLFVGLQQHLEPNGIEHRPVPFNEPLKGLEILGSSTLLHKLIPPAEPGKSGRLLQEDYRRQREVLRDEVQFIPVFGDLFDPIPMRENFINLSLRSEDAWRFAPEPSSAPDPTEGEHDRGFARDFGRLSERARVERELSAEELFTRFNKGCILGMPGAGKTTILKHFLYQLLEDQRNAVVLFLNCRDLRPGNFAPASLEDTLHALALAFLHPTRSPTDLNDKERKAVGGVAEDVQAAWQRGQATVLIDALDETPGEELKDAVVRVASSLRRSRRPCARWTRAAIASSSRHARSSRHGLTRSGCRSLTRAT